MSNRRENMTHLGIVNVVLNDLDFVQPPTVSVVQGLRKVPVIQGLRMRSENGLKSHIFSAHDKRDDAIL